jgi:hypothetical protein
MSVKIALDLQFAAPDSGRLIPMDFGQADGAILELNPCHSLSLPPAAGSVASTQTRDFRIAAPIAMVLMSSTPPRTRKYTG